MIISKAEKGFLDFSTTETYRKREHNSIYSGLTALGRILARSNFFRGFLKAQIIADVMQGEPTSR